MSNNALLSGEQALDDYFAALLDEEVELEETQATTPQDESLDAPESLHAVEASWEPEPQVQPVAENSYILQSTVDLEVPNLEDVERLLKQLESTNPVADLQLEEVMEQNTAAIAQVEPDIVEPEVEEIQDWVIDEPLAPTLEAEAFVEEDVATFEPPLTEVVDEAPIAEVPAVEVPIAEVEQHIESTVEVQSELETSSGNALDNWQSTERHVSFQVLYFEVNGVTFAVPLDELGGIHRIGDLNHLIGRPSWYLGLQTNRDSQLDVVDTAKWVMAQKLKDDSYKDEYQYIVMLGESLWGLASTQLLGTESLSPEKVRWRVTAGKRPWLAGMVKEKMCALVHVEALIAMLNAGLDVKALDK
ncbi:chemotaxis protein CheW [Vibrio scophthalmi]|uniref:chemotaxis protein CheW n=1 Tax=Vibrio scophthalmi TaxID=45658 RepID=UPI002FF2EFB9